MDTNELLKNVIDLIDKANNYDEIVKENEHLKEEIKIMDYKLDQLQKDNRDLINQLKSIKMQIATKDVIIEDKI